MNRDKLERRLQVAETIIRKTSDDSDELKEWQGGTPDYFAGRTEAIKVQSIQRLEKLGGAK